ncbi:MAG: hypothetical protein NC084_09920 [Bacteroides sp.]|nr:hypothetical protein [Eubacterium sp.]MCM1419365.1 hypothetical protein [Roseburia sp.]MCM1463015.1 hypothetical protein [Bacteroides sp.]
MYRCGICDRTEEAPLFRADRFDRALYPICRSCHSVMEASSALCRCCGRALFPGERVYEAEDKLYCTDCVTEVII